METFVFAKTLPNNSIVNPDVDSSKYLDYNQPFSFFDFLKYTNANVSPLQYNDLYIEYIKGWNVVKKSTQTQIDESIRDRYVELLKEITLKYSTTEEKRFLSNIDFNDPLDLDIIIPFYSKKLREICNFYSEKREKLKFKIEKNKIKGTPTSVEKSIIETVTDTLFSDSIEVGLYQKIVNQSDLLANLDIEIEELYDMYTNYLDNDPDNTYSTYGGNTPLRETLYTSNLNEIDGNIFINLEKAIQNQIFSNIRLFLVEFGKRFTINYDLTKVNLNCKTGDPLSTLILSNKAKATREVELRYTLIKKYIGTDFYYIQTGSTLTDIVSAKLFTADNPTGNLLNRHFPTTASVEEESELESLRRIGLFFTPDKTGILYFSVPEKKYKIDTSKLETNKLYIFPDPELYGNTTGLTRSFDSAYPLIHIQDYSKSVKGVNYFSAEGDINSNPFNQDFYAYFSRNQITNNKILGNDGLHTNLSELNGIGRLTKWTTDVYGNQYGLYKPFNKRSHTNNTISLTTTNTILEIYDGGPITFHTNEFLPEQVYTQKLNWVYPNVYASNYYYNLLIGGGIGGYINGLMQPAKYTKILIDGRGIVNQTPVTFDVIFNGLSATDMSTIDGNAYINPSPIDISYDINPLSGFQLLNYIIDGNLYDTLPSNLLTPTTKTVDGNPVTNSSQYASDLSLTYTTSSINYKKFDGGNITDSYDEIYDFDETENFIVTQVLDSSKTVFATNNIQEIDENLLRFSNGQIYVKNIVTAEVNPLSSALDVQFSKYPTQIKTEIYTTITNFNVYNNVIWIRTPNYLVFDTISYDVDDFQYSGTTNNYITLTSNGLANCSEPFIFENKDYGIVAVLELSATISNQFYIIPKVYKFTYNTAKLTKLYPDTITSEFINTVSANPVNLNNINSVSLTYNSRNDLFSIVAVLEDQNEFPYVYNFKFKFNGSVVTVNSIVLTNSQQAEAIKTLNSHDNDLFSNGSLIYNNILNLSATRNVDLGAIIF